MPYYLESWCNLNYFFFLLVIFSIIFGAFEGNLPEVSRAALEESSHAVRLSLELLGMLCFWGGLMEAAKRSGLTEKICFALLPVLGTIFPRLRKEKAALGAISMNITANMLGLGNAATPLGIAAMKELKSWLHSLKRDGLFCCNEYGLASDSSHNRCHTSHGSRCKQAP